MNNKIYLSSPHMGGKEQHYVNKAFDENWIAPLGPNVKGFESDLEKYLGEEVHVATLSSGTAAIHLALVQLNVGQGDEVLCQSLTFAASANPIVYQGATPIFIDSEPDTFNICPEFLEIAIEERIKLGKKPKAIIAVHLYGMPYKVKEIHDVAEKYEIPVIEDSAEALGSTYNNQKCGTFGDFAILSFNGNKIITTSGGGALVTRSNQEKEKTIFLATQARDEAPHYQHSEIGYNYRLSNVCAGIGRGQMEVLDGHVEKRRSMNRFYQQLFEGVKGARILIEPENNYFCNHWLSVLKTEATEDVVNVEELRIFLNERNIESRPLWKPMHIQPVFKDAPFYGSGVAVEAFNSGLCLPSGSNLSEEEKNRISDAIRTYLKNKNG
jgi:dTDP-4-amino-4,6-dideoxygalactose transaminase